MRCSNCGLPLSPENKRGSCPRCSAPIGQKSSSNAVQAPAAWPPSQANQGYEWGMGTGQPQQQGEGQYAGWQAGPGGPGDTPSPAPLFQSFEQPQQQDPFPAQISLQTPAQMAARASAPHSIPRMQSLAPSSTPAPAPISPLNGRMQAENYTWKAGRSRHSGQLGFTIAGICIITGALLLIFVYIISMELSQNPAAVGTVTPARTQPTSTAHAQLTATSPAASPSPTAFPGQQYISNPQMASSIDEHTAQPTQKATTFPVGKPVYVTFAVNPNGQAGEVCLSWYLNGTFTSNYSFAVGSTPTTAYSYTYYHASGPAYVEISWSNSANCTNALLAQRVDFTIQG